MVAWVEWAEEWVVFKLTDNQCHSEPFGAFMCLGDKLCEESDQILRVAQGDNHNNN